MYLSLILNVILRFYLPQKKTSELSFCSRFKMYVLMVSILPFAVKIIRLITSPAVKKVSFPQSRNFSPVKKLFHNKGPFPQSRNFFTVVEIFHNQGTFPVVKIFHSQGNFQQKQFTWSKEFSTNNEVFYSQGNFPQKNFFDQTNFPQTRKFSTKYFSLIKKVFHKQRLFASKD